MVYFSSRNSSLPSKPVLDLIIMICVRFMIISVFNENSCDHAINQFASSGFCLPVLIYLVQMMTTKHEVVALKKT